jgi:DNA-binding transcriptional regulator PaaX
MKQSKKSLQEMILDVLSQSKARKKREIIHDIEVFLEDHEESERKLKPKYLINRALKKMVDDEMVEEHTTERSSFLSLGSSGRQKLRSIKLSSQNHLTATTWDGYWRMVIVDIPESRKKDQDAIRYLLKKAQFVQIKSAVWISPYPMEHMMINIKQDMGLEEDVLVLVTDKLDVHTEKLLMEKFAEAQNKVNSDE